MSIIDGRFVGAGKSNLYMKQIGTGSPVVVIEASLGGLSVEWQEIQTELAKHTTVISYDRAGYGESPKGELPRTSRQIAAELFTMLLNSGFDGPFILIGHSAGGLYVQHFAMMFPNKVAGIMLVDSISQKDNDFDLLEAPEFQKLASLQARISNIKQILALEKDEIKKVLAPMLQKVYSELPELLRSQLVEYQTTKGFYQTIVDEYEGREESFAQMKSLSTNLNIPLKVICRDFEVMLSLTKELGIPETEARLTEELWLKNSKDLLALSTDSEFILAKGSSHMIHLTRPDVVINEALDLLKKV